MPKPATAHFDVIIVGGGLSGVNAAYHVQAYRRHKSYVILEAGDAIGGTWDLFRYPGIRSGSDMYTFGYSFHPCAYVVRLMNYMRRHGYIACTPRQHDPSVTAEPLIDFSSGYLQRAIDQFPRQGSKKPWRLHQNYVRDLLAVRFGAVNDKALEFTRRADARAVA